MTFFAFLYANRASSHQRPRMCTRNIRQMRSVVLDVRVSSVSWENAELGNNAALIHAISGGGNRFLNENASGDGPISVMRCIFRLASSTVGNVPSGIHHIAKA